MRFACTRIIGFGTLDQSIIRNIDGLPFDEAAANHLAAVLSNETGRRYRAIPWQSGYGVKTFSTTYPSVDKGFGELSTPRYTKPIIVFAFFYVVISGIPVDGIDHVISRTGSSARPAL